MTWRPTGRPSTVPAGMDTAGLPVRLAGMVSAPLLPMALLKPYSLMRSTPPTVVGMGPVAAKAVSGLVAQKTKSVCSNRVAICSLRSMRNISVRPAVCTSRLWVARLRPSWISGVRSSLQPG